MSMQQEIERLHERLDRIDSKLETLLTHELRIGRLEGHVANVVKAIGAVVVTLLTGFCAFKLGIKGG